MRRTALVVSAFALLGAAPAFAGTLPVGVSYSTKDGVSVGTTINNQPGAGAYVRGNEACVGFSYQIPQCVDLTQR